jgi:hypothetical protein
VVLVTVFMQFSDNDTPNVGQQGGWQTLPGLTSRRAEALTLSTGLSRPYVTH